ncbi:MAG TPA: SAM-dependent methyltransferase [Terrimicrobiaceae bacterium]
MCAKSLALNKILAEIAKEGPLTFARFMDLALYDPVAGYYASGRGKIGKRGDFFTNVSVGPVFGRILAEQFREMWSCLGRPSRFALVEQGANDGQLAADILSAINQEALPAIEYWIVEPFPVLRRLQEQTLKAFGGRVYWAEDLDALPVFDGVHFSNELVDAMPFHLLQSTGEGWKELFVAAHEHHLAFEAGDPQELLTDCVKILPRRIKGTLAELRPAARTWIQTIASKLRTGFLFIIDYGFSREQLLSPHRAEGTFACYRAHRRDARPLEEPGEKDITAHVDFTELAESARDSGFRIEGFADQHHYLVGASQDLLKRLDGPPDSASQKTLRSLQTLLHPEIMGTQFHYLALSKGVSLSSGLSSFQFARGPCQGLFPSGA